MLTRFSSFLHGILRRRAIDAEADEELQFHLASEIEANVARGMSPAEARRIALRDLGGLTQAREGVRAVRTLGLSDVWRDLRYGARALAGAPKFTVVAMLTIGLMVGGVSAIFSLVNAVLLRPLPYPDAGRLVAVESIQPKAFGTTVERGDASEFQRHGRSVEQWGLYRIGYVVTVPDAAGEPIEVQDLRVTADLFPMLGITVALGRPLVSSDGAPDRADVAVIGHDLWQTLFAGARDVVGQTILIRGQPVTIVGVTRPGADVPRNWLSYPIVWRPLGEADAGASMQSLTTLARLRPGASVESARRELDAVARRLEAEHPDTHEDRTVRVTPLLDKVVGDFGRALWIFFAAVSCVLLIGVGNLIGLQLARNGARAREITLRLALGAGRWRVVRQLGIEAMLLSVCGGAAGFAVAAAAIQAIAGSLPAGFPRADQIGIDMRVALFAFGVSLSVGLVVGIVPWFTSRTDIARRLAEGGRTGTLTASQSRLQRALIVCQTAVALVLLIAAGLLTNSLYRLGTRDAGMREAGLWVVRGTLPSRYGDDAAQAAFWTTALEQVRSMEGIESAALIVNSGGPLSGSDISTLAVPEGFSGNPRDALRVSYRRVSDQYFATVGMPVLKGRPILPSDVAGREPVVVVNELAAAALWPGQDPLGKRLVSGTPLTVVGVIPTFRHARLEEDPVPQLYRSYVQDQGLASTSAIVFRTRPGADAAAGAIPPALMRLEKSLDVRASTLADMRWALLATERFRVLVLLTFAGTAVILALVGIVGLVAHTVGQRQREIAVRVVMGALRRDILQLASRQALVPALTGLVIGTLVAVVATRVLASFLVDIQAVDVPTFAAALAGLGVAASVASLLPARRALRVRPMDALRAE